MLRELRRVPVCEYIYDGYLGASVRMHSNHFPIPLRIAHFVSVADS